MSGLCLVLFCFFVSSFRSSSQNSALISSCSFVQYNVDRRLQAVGGGEGAVLGDLLLPGVRTHPAGCCPTTHF